ncbi:TetM/TetW/TetO/TetS family tetracycline resistance ribosomal protection protein [Caldibacillus lycopersici]|uniref:TetM/TetW/TetO/TetS family tetracycline resistance ribosomal protection protein n=1 Tax=Perspicuibacillus lycopersici TaxID=1325689 RepID=A0AAE3ISR4_9BACI|nr:TetM/TetW/TetO/TetS family tetracycline resistance ribosomal protection protein [Perspicuibacillus lycopersici]MCU9612756.1 TetM/TetW/TetO/TetS family tetracycline resistance ribosomal protection protein [Perspicuibacillus lycopersici]
MNKTIGILAHVDAGKTTFSEQLLYHTHTIKQVGRVDHQNTFLDSHTIEKQRGITVFSDQAMFTFGSSNYFLIDTPGHVDFSPEMERAIQVMDYAILVISAVEGIEGHTETVWELLRKHQIPTFFFINKMDRTGADKLKVIEEIKENLTENVMDITGALIDGVMKEDLIEFLAEQQEDLLEHYLTDGYEKEKWLQAMQQLIASCQLYPITSGSALHNQGIQNFLDSFDCLTKTAYRSDMSFSGKVYKIRFDQSGTRVTFIKALSGKLKVREELNYGSSGNQVIEKVTQIRLYNGNKHQTVEEVVAGELFAVTGLSNATVGDGVGSIETSATFAMIPTLTSKVVFESAVPMKEALRIFNILDAEDPSLNVTWNEQLQEIHIHVMGTIQLEVLKQMVEERFQLQISFEQPKILYKETMDTSVIGYGHFEPLRHYAEVHLKMEPAKRNSGIHFTSECHTDDLPVGLQSLIGQHIFERPHHGLLTGSPLTDVKFTLLTGRSHNKHTHGGDFREATFRALRQGLEKANNRLLEPYYSYKIKVDLEQMGRVLTDIQAAYGKYDSPKIDGNKAILTGIVPVATFLNYHSILASFTQGKGTLRLSFAGYFDCHNEAEVIDRIGYQKDADPNYTSSSMFCAKGQSFSVPWDEAEKKMHCL